MSLLARAPIAETLLRVVNDHFTLIAAATHNQSKIQAVDSILDNMIDEAITIADAPNVENLERAVADIAMRAATDAVDIVGLGDIGALSLAVAVNLT